jgi:uncharacterized membrane protein YfcA
MDLTQLFILAAIGILAGFIGGSMGVGGGIIIIPALMIFLGFSQKEAQGTSLAVLTMPVAFVAAFNYYKEGYINMKFAAIMIVTFVIGSYLGSKFALSIPASTLKKIFAVLLVVIGIKMLLGK